jgi:hypothetical protein
MPPIDIYLSWRPRSSGGDWKYYRIGVVLNHILLVNLFYIKDGLGGIFLLDPKVNVVPTISCLSELPIRYHVNIKSRNKYNVSQ